MDRKRIMLDNPVFAGTLRYQHRSAAYVRRPTQPAAMNDIVVPRTVKPAPKPQLAPHAVLPKQAFPTQSVERSSTPPTQTMPASKPAIVNHQSTIPSATRVPEQMASKPSKPQASGSRKRLPAIKKPSVFRKNAILYAMAGVIFTAGLVVSFTGFRANKQVAAQVTQSQKTSDDDGTKSSAPSTVKPSDEAIRKYSVSPNVPRYLDIAKLKIHTRILSEGVNKRNELQTPWNIYDAGWYNASSQPGQNGAMLVDGHSGVGNMHGVFYKLATLTAGDPISVTRGDGKVFTYKVVKVQTVDVDNVNMASMLVSADTSRPGLNLITCTGDQIPGTTELNKRVQVYAVLQ